MKTRRNLVHLAAWASTLATFATSAQAHILLDAPMRRADHTNDIKTAPCGPQGGSTRSTDPARITTYAPGQTITVEWHETIHHPSHYRIAFDDDGQDDFVDKTGPTDIMDPPLLPVLLDGIPDKSNMSDTFAVEVTLPDIECDNCTLQLIQYMTDRNEPYYQCADLVLKGEPGGTGGADGQGTGGEGSSEGSGGAVGGTGAFPGVGGTPLGTGGGSDLLPASGGGPSTAGTGGEGSGGVPAAAAGGASSGGMMAVSGGANDPGTGGTPGMTMQDWMKGASEGEQGGCSVSASGASREHSPGFWLALIFAAFGLRRRASRRC